MRPKAVAMLSGGLDSELAAKLVLDCGVELLGFHLLNAFAAAGRPGRRRLRAQRVACELGMPLKLEPFTERLSRLVVSPAHGHGSEMNPCIDCRIEALRLAWKYAGEEGGAFLVSGELLGQRPMTQRREAMALIDREAAVEGKVLRPLSALLLPVTDAEREGLVMRERLLDLRGRSRKRQLALVKEYDLNEFSSPAGGCLLTDPAFSGRLREFFSHGGTLDLNELHVLKLGRHFRLNDGTRAVVGREERDNLKLLSYLRPGDVAMEAAAGSSPIALLRGRATDENIRLAAAITARYSRHRREREVEVVWWGEGRDGRDGRVTVEPASDALSRELLVRD